MKYREATKTLEKHRKEIANIREEMRKVQAATEPEAVSDYVFKTTDGDVGLADLFGTHKELIMIHNMGASCVYCTLWADGYNGIYDHLANRAAFVVSSPDKPAAQKKFAAGRGWRFPLVSHAGSTFAEDMGYVSKSGGFTPGISVFQKSNGRILRVSDTHEGPGDDFCAAWHLFDMLPQGADGWQPKFKYAA